MAGTPTTIRATVVALKTKRTGASVEEFIRAIPDEQRRKDCRIMAGFRRYDELLGRLGKHTIGKSCLYIKRLDDVDLDVLTELVERSVQHVATSSQPE